MLQQISAHLLCLVLSLIGADLAKWQFSRLIKFSNFYKVSQHKILISGRVVDIKGEPLPNAIIRLDVAPEGDLITSVLTASDGTFFYEDDSPLLKNKRKLFVAAPLPSGTCTFIGPPYDDTPSNFYLRKTGKRIEVFAGTILKVGDITPSVTYKVVELILMGENNAPLLTQMQDWQKTWIRVRDSKNRIITTSTIAQSKIHQAVNLSASSIKLAMPAGRWSIEFKTPRSGTLWLKAPKLITFEDKMHTERISITP